MQNLQQYMVAKVDFRELEIFIHLSQSLQFSKTAHSFHMSPSTLSRTIQRLEEELNEQLFERDNRTVRLTLSGKKLLQFAMDVNFKKQELLNSFKQNPESISGELTLFCTVTAAHIYVPRLLETFREQYPNAEIRLETGDVAQAFEKVRTKEADFAYAVYPEKLKNQYQFHSVESIPFKFIGPTMNTQFSQYLHESEINWQKLPFVMPESGPVKKQIEKWFKEMNLNPEVYAQVSGHEAIVSLTALGCGVSAIPEPVFDLSPLKDKVEVLPSSVPPKPLNLGICCLKKRLSNPLNQAFWNIVQDLY